MRIDDIIVSIKTRIQNREKHLKAAIAFGKGIDSQFIEVANQEWMKLRNRMDTYE